MTTWASGRLDERSDLSRFDCGVTALNQWLSGRALEAQARGTAATYVWTAPATGSDADAGVGFVEDGTGLNDV